MARNPRIAAPFSNRTIAMLDKFQTENSNAYKCKDPRHEKPLSTSKSGLLCSKCSYVQNWCHMFLDDVAALEVKPSNYRQKAKVESAYVESVRKD